MSKKIGRNEKCPCGSGEKYKKCCLTSGGSVHTNVTNNNAIQPSSIFNQYNTANLIKKCAALSLIPENHGKCIRIEELARKSALNFNTNSATISHAEFQSYLNTNYSSNYLEDAPVNLFTDLVTFYGGDYLIFPGITETGSYTLYSLLSAIYNWPDSGIHNHVKNNSMHASLLVFTLSNTIAK